MPYTPEQRARLVALRAKCADGSVTQAEYAEAISLLREDRFACLQLATLKKAKAAGGSRKRKAKADPATLIDQSTTQGTQS